MSVSADTIKHGKPVNPSWHPVSIWRWLTDPPDNVKEPELRRRMRFLSSLLVILIPLSLVGSISSNILTRPDLSLLQDSTFLAILGGCVVLSIAYALGRTEKYYTAGAVLALVMFSIGSVGTAAIDPADLDNLLVFLAMDILLGSLLLSLKNTALLAVVDTAAVLLVPVLTPQVTLFGVVNVLIYVILMAVLIVVSAAIRQQDLRQIEGQSLELASALQRAEDANKLKSQFLATMSHELRTPLNAIIGFSEVMIMGLAGELPSEAKRTTDRIHYNSERLLRLIDDLLDISRIEAGRLEISRSPFEPASLLENIERTIKPQAVKKGLKFVTVVDPTLPHPLMGDAQRLERIILNLASNAVKFTDRGGIKISLSHADGNNWCIRVDDTGIGIPAHAQEFIFEKFRQVDGTSRRAYSGVGLGLAIVSELAALMDGSVRVASKVGEGSTFTVTLPIILLDGKHR